MEEEKDKIEHIVQNLTGMAEGKAMFEDIKQRVMCAASSSSSSSLLTFLPARPCFDLIERFNLLLCLEPY